MSNAWTPGPWKAEPPGYFKNWSVTCPRHDEWYDRATVAVANPGDVAVYSKADAHLIAAAPDLYEALDTLLRVYPNTNKEPGWVIRVENAWSACRAALAKARGEQ